MKVNLAPEKIKEWENEDLMAGTLGPDVKDASAAQAQEMLKEISLNLPPDILKTELVDFNSKLQTPLSLDIPPNSDFNYFLIDVPLNIVLTEVRMVRLDLRLDMKPQAIVTEPVVAYDLFPNDKVDVKNILSGDFSLDIAKALTFVTKIPFGDILNLKLEKPFSWTSQSITIQCSDRMSNPVRWYVRDESIQNGFTGYVIIRSPKKTSLDIDAILAVELRKAGLSGYIQKATYKSIASTYHIKAE